MTVHLDNASTKTVLLTIAAKLRVMAERDHVKQRRDALIKSCADLQRIANGRAVARLTEYSE